jgi:hypothetical protein
LLERHDYPLKHAVGLEREGYRMDGDGKEPPAPDLSDEQLRVRLARFGIAIHITDGDRRLTPAIRNRGRASEDCLLWTRRKLPGAAQPAPIG